MIYLKELYDTEKKHFHSQVRRDLCFGLTQSRYEAFKTTSMLADIGCASGIFLEYLHEKGFKHLYGIDPNPDSISFMREKLPHAHLYALYLKDFLRQEHKVFDFVFLLDVLEHVEDDAAFLAEVKHVLKDTSKLVISVPALQWLWSDHDRMCNHFRRYSKKSLIKLLEVCGFRIEYCSYYSTLLFPLILAQKFMSKVKKYKDHTSFLPPPLLNKLFKVIYSIEIPLLKRIRFPFGSSLICFASKRAN